MRARRDNSHLQGAIVTAIVALAWWIVGTGPIEQPFGPVLIVLGIILTLVLGYLARQQITRQSGPAKDAVRPGRAYWVTILSAVVIMILVSIVCNALGWQHQIPALIAIVVGLHFLPFARIIRRPSYQAVAAGLVTLGAATVLLLALDVLKGDWWLIIPGIGSALVIWTDAALAVIFPDQ